MVTIGMIELMRGRERERERERERTHTLVGCGDELSVELIWIS